MARIVYRAVQCGVLIICTAPLYAQAPDAATSGQPASTGDEAARAITLTEVEAALAAVESDIQLDDAVKNVLRAKYQQAIAALLEAESLNSKAAEYRDSLQSAPKRAAELRGELQALPAANSVADLPEMDDPAELQRELDLRRITLDEAREESVRKTLEVNLIGHRPVEINSRIPQIERNLREIREELSSPELAPSVKSPSRIAERTLLLAQQLRLSNERKKLEQELSSLAAREDLLKAEQDLLRQQVTLASSAVDALDSLLYERLDNQAREFLARVESLSEDLAERDVATTELVVESQELARDYDHVIRHLQSVEAARRDVSDLLQTLEAEYSSLQEQRELSGAGVSTVQGIYSLQRRALTARIDVETTGLPALDEMRLASLQIREKLDRQIEVEQAFADASADAARQLVSTRRELLESLQKQYGRQIRALADLNRYKEQYHDRAEELRSYVSEQLLGFQIRSCPPINIDSLTEIPQGLVWVFRGVHWRDFGSAVVRIIEDRPVMSVGLLVVVAGLVLGRRWIQSALVRCGDDVGRISKDRFGLTLQALIWSVLLAAPFPLLISFACQAAFHSAQTSDWMLGLADGLWRVARIASFGAVTLAVCHPGGLGPVHFGWSDHVLVPLRRSIRRLMVVYLPAVVLTSICALGESAKYFGSVGMFSVLVTYVWALIIIRQLIRAFDGAPEKPKDDLRTHRPSRWQRLGLLLLQMCVIGLSIVACLGYLITATQLTLGLVWTAARIFGGVILYYLALRWFMIKQRRLMLAEAIEKRRVRQQAAGRDEQNEMSGEIVSVDPEDQHGMDLDVVSDQLRNLLRVLFSLAVAVVVILFWTRIYPLIDVLDSVPVPLGEGLTLLGLIKATLITVVVFIMVRILPGLLELAFLRATTIDSGTRNAIYTLGQYAVIAVGFLMVMHAVNMDWARLGWIAAGLSVGLGFGMQEVVANFVCGLILLFERPIRVGDVVTIDGTTGTVTRINIRATTITNWDRQDFVVPNKNLITGTILNWTLTASVNRVVVSVGVAYDSDTEQARQLLLDVANDHPRILDDPAPIASFDQFGDSSLNLVLNAYLPDLNHRIRTITELHTEIKKRFAAAGIEIPFPQRDVHLRSETDVPRVADGTDDDQLRSGPDSNHAAQ